MLQFATGLTIVPPHFTIHHGFASESSFPTAHTCRYVLHPPSYDTEKEMETKILDCINDAGFLSKFDKLLQAGFTTSKMSLFSSCIHF